MSSLDSFLDTPPPQDLEAERCVLGSVLLVNESLDEVSSIIGVNQFYRDGHRRIYKAMSEMYEAGSRGMDAVTLRDELTRRGELAICGGVPYLMQLLETVPHASHAGYYAKIVAETWKRRSIIEACTESLKEAYNGGCDADDILAACIGRMESITSGEEIKEVNIVETIERIFGEIVSDEPQTPGLSTGWKSIDKRTGSGMKPGQLIVIGARPEVGKSAFAGEILRHNVNERESVLFFSLEMSGDEVFTRLMSSQARVETRRMRDGTVDDMDQHALSEAAETMKQWPISVIERPDISIDLMCAKIRFWVRKNRGKLVIIDYLQLIQAADRRVPREQQVSDITRRLKIVAKQSGVPVIVLCQLNRDAADVAPKLKNLRESGSIEQDADIVFLLHRPDKIDPEDRPGELDVIDAKSRHSTQRGTVTLRAWKEMIVFVEDTGRGNTEDVPDSF